MGRHSREGGNPGCSGAKAKMDSRLRGNDGHAGDDRQLRYGTNQVKVWESAPGSSMLMRFPRLDKSDTPRFLTTEGLSMLSNKFAATLFPLFAYFVSGSAFAGWTCPDDGKPLYVTGVGYDNKHYQPRIHFNTQKPGDWSYLSYSYGVNTYEGKAMLAIALTAYATGGTVRVRCYMSGNYGYVDGLWLTQDGSKSPD